MAINHIYAPDPTFAAQAISQAGGAEYQQGQQDRLQAIEQFNAQLEQRDRQFYDQLAYQQDSQALGYAQNQDQLAMRAYEGDQNRMAGLAESEMRNQYGLADTALRGNLQAAMQGQQTAGMMARDMQETRLKQAMSEHDAIQKAWLDGEHFTSDEQFKQAKGAWENKWGALGLTWGLPDQIAQQQAQQNDEMMVGQIESSFFTNPIDKSLLIDGGAVQSLLKLGMEPKEIATLGVKMQAEARQRAALQQKEKQEEIARQGEIANIERDNALNAQKFQHTQTAHEQKMAFEAEQAKQKLMMNAVNSYQAARLKWATAKNAAKDDEGKSTLGPEPKFEDFMPPTTDMESQMEPGLRGGKIVTSPAGKRAILHEDGSVSPLD